MASNLGNSVKQELEVAGMTLSGLANHTGLSKSFLSNFLSGKRDVSSNSLDKIAKALGRQANFFYRAPGQSAAAIQRFQDLVLSSVDLSQHHKRKLLTQLGDDLAESLLTLISEFRGRGYHSVVREFVWNDRILTLPGPDELHALTHLNNERRLETILTVTGDKCTSLPLRTIQTFDDRGTKYQDFRQELDLGSCEVPVGKVELWKGRPDPNLRYAEVRFKPALVQGQRARVVVKESFHCSHVGHKQLLLDLISNGKLIDHIPIVFSGFLCGLPTRHLITQVTFPSDYEPEDFLFTVHLNRMPLQEEVSRLEKGKAFTVHKDEEGRWVCKLEVQKPLTGANYMLQWIPPSEEIYHRLLRRLRRGGRTTKSPTFAQ